MGSVESAGPGPGAYEPPLGSAGKQLIVSQDRIYSLCALMPCVPRCHLPAACYLGRHSLASEYPQVQPRFSRKGLQTGTSLDGNGAIHLPFLWQRLQVCRTYQLRSTRFSLCLRAVTGLLF